MLRSCPCLILLLICVASVVASGSPAVEDLQYELDFSSFSYVSPLGDDANANCTRDEPCSTIQRALTFHSDVVVLEGQYSLQTKIYSQGPLSSFCGVGCSPLCHIAKFSKSSPAFSLGHVTVAAEEGSHVLFDKTSTFTIQNSTVEFTGLQILGKVVVADERVSAFFASCKFQGNVVDTSAAAGDLDQLEMYDCMFDPLSTLIVSGAADVVLVGCTFVNSTVELSGVRQIKLLSDVFDGSSLEAINGGGATEGSLRGTNVTFVRVPELALHVVGGNSLTLDSVTFSSCYSGMELSGIANVELSSLVVIDTGDVGVIVRDVAATTVNGANFTGSQGAHWGVYNSTVSMLGSHLEGSVDSAIKVFGSSSSVVLRNSEITKSGRRESGRPGAIRCEDNPTVVFDNTAVYSNALDVRTSLQADCEHCGIASDEICPTDYVSFYLSGAGRDDQFCGTSPDHPCASFTYLASLVTHLEKRVILQETIWPADTVEFNKGHGGMNVSCGSVAGCIIDLSALSPEKPFAKAPYVAASEPQVVSFSGVDFRNGGARSGDVPFFEFLSGNSLSFARVSFSNVNDTLCTVAGEHDFLRMESVKIAHCNFRSAGGSSSHSHHAVGVSSSLLLSDLEITHCHFDATAFTSEGSAPTLVRLEEVAVIDSSSADSLFKFIDPVGISLKQIQVVRWNVSPEGDCDGTYCGPHSKSAIHSISRDRGSGFVFLEGGTFSEISGASALQSFGGSVTIQDSEFYRIQNQRSVVLADSPTVKIFTSHFTESGSGAVLLTRLRKDAFPMTVTIANSTFRHNEADKGAHIRSKMELDLQDQVAIMDCGFFDGLAGIGGGAFAFDRSSVSISRSKFDNNVALRGSDVIACYQSKISLLAGMRGAFGSGQVDCKCLYDAYNPCKENGTTTGDVAPPPIEQPIAPWKIAIGVLGVLGAVVLIVIIILVIRKKQGGTTVAYTALVSDDVANQFVAADWGDLEDGEYDVEY